MWHTSPPVRQRFDPGDETALRTFLGRAKPAAVAALTVITDGLALAERILAGSDRQLLIAGRDLPCPLQLAYDERAGLGVDRWVAAFAAHRLYRAAVVVDCGTAVTVDFVAADGRLIAGAIAPGAGPMAAALAAAAPALPAVRWTPGFDWPATSSQAAVDAGVQLGFCGMIDHLVAALLATATSGVAPTRVLTGGGAAVYLQNRENRENKDGGFRHHPDLLHQGLRWLYEMRSSNS